MKNNKTNKVVAKKVCYNRYQQLKSEQEEREFQKQVRRSDIISGIICCIIIIAVLIISIIFGIQHMQTVDFALGLISIIGISSLGGVVLYFIIGNMVHGYSDY